MYQIETDPKSGVTYRTYGNGKVIVYNAKALEKGVRGVAIDFHGTITCEEGEQTFIPEMINLIEELTLKNKTYILTSARRNTVISSGIGELLPEVKIRSTQNMVYQEKATHYTSRHGIKKYYAGIVKIPQAIGCNVLIDDALIVSEEQEPTKLNFCGIKPVNLSCGDIGILRSALQDLELV